MQRRQWFERLEIRKNVIRDPQRRCILHASVNNPMPDRIHFLAVCFLLKNGKQ